jgi:membrane protease subunit HflC
MNRFYAVLVLLAVGVIGLFGFTFTVKETERALKLKLGEIVQADYEPGLHFKLPFVNSVRKFDSRVLTMDAAPDRVLTVEKKNVIVDAFVKWRIVDTARFFNSTGGNEQLARGRLHEFIKNQLYDEFGKRTIQEVVSGERAAIMNAVQQVTDSKSEELGIDVVDVRIKRVDLPDNVSQSVFQRMEKERNAVAQEFRALGREEAQVIRATAQRKVQEILADAYRRSQEIRGEGDAKAANVYARAYQQDEEFYAFYRSLLAYERSFDGGRDALVLEPDSEFFDYFGNAEGR